MQTILPDAISLTASSKGNDVEFRYCEEFRRTSYVIEDETVARQDLLKLTSFALREALGHLNVVVDLVGDDKIEIRGFVSRTKFGNMMTMEFMGWGSVGDMKFRDVLLTLSRKG